MKEIIWKKHELKWDFAVTRTDNFGAGGLSRIVCVINIGPFSRIIIIVLKLIIESTMYKQIHKVWENSHTC